MASQRNVSQPPSNRRRFARAPLNLLVRYKFASVDALVADETLDVSEGGMYMRSKRPQPVGSQVFFQILLETGTVMLEGMARVVRARESQTDGVASGMALEFVSMDPISRDVLRTLVDTHRKASSARA